MRQTRILVCLAFLLTLPLTRAAAQTSSDMFSAEVLQRVAAEVVADQEAQTVLVSPPTNYRPYWMVFGWLAAATLYDVEATFYRLDHCDECQEANPIVRPFIERGRLATYAYSVAVNGAVMYVARRMYDRGHPWWRVAPLTFVIVHVVAGTLNLYLGAHGES